MKGEALITVKGKDGKIKQQVKENNLVFDLPKENYKNYLKYIDFGEINAGSYNASPCHCYGLFSEYFGSIAINDEVCSTTDYKDFKMPVLFGGEQTAQNSNRTRYAYIDTANSSKVGNVMKKSYTWNNCPAFTIRSINLKHLRAIYGGFGKEVYNNNNIAFVKECAFRNDYGSTSDNISQNAKGVYPNILYKKSSFDWSLDYGRKGLSTVCKVGGYNTAGQYSTPTSYKCHITALKNDEIAILKNDTDLTVQETTGNAQYLIILDANDGTIKRSFPLTQFDGFVGYNSSNHYITKDYVRIVATDFGSFIVMSKTNSNSNLFVWKIPEQSEMSNYSNNETISVYADLSSTGLTSNSLVVLNEYLIYSPSTLTSEKTIRINNDAQSPYTEYDYAPFNGYFSAPVQLGKFYTPVAGARVYNYTSYTGMECWYNTTVLNLSEGVEVAQGDTVTIEYTITAN